MTQKNQHQQSYWITLVGILLALLVCLAGCSMVVLAYPQSLDLIQVVINQGLSDWNSKSGLAAMVAQPTPFQPVATATATNEPDPTIAPTQLPTLEPTLALTPIPTDSQEPNKISPDTVLPVSASTDGINGSLQFYTLDCEIQSAADWSRYFGKTIDRNEFFDRLPKSDDPEEGFVGNINGPMGQLPPSDYGVHAAPVAKLLREYGLPAKASRNWSLEEIKNEIASGKPVIAWIVNLPFDIESTQYTASNGNTTPVARFEHTWIITAYDATTVTVVDSEWTYRVKHATFLERWQVLGSQVIYYDADY
jgi:uncharacterized protein YvpB